MFQREVEETDTINVLEKGIIIESYEDDYPFSSVLVNGLSETEMNLHIVVGIDSGFKCLYLITVYTPDVERWTNNFSERINK